MIPPTFECSHRISIRVMVRDDGTRNLRKGDGPRVTRLVVIFDKNSTALLFAFSYCTVIGKKLGGVRNVRLRPVHAYQLLNIDIAYKNVSGDGMDMCTYRTSAEIPIFRILS